MSTSSPLVSVIVPVYNGAQHLREAVRSIERQDYQPLEIIVVDDGSTDETPRVIASLGDRVRALRQDNAGPAAARNYGITASHGQLLAFCDADDTWPDGKLHLQVGRLQQDTGTRRRAWDACSTSPTRANSCRTCSSRIPTRRP